MTAPDRQRRAPDGFLLLFGINQTALLAPDGPRCLFLSEALSLLPLAVEAKTARKYAHALRQFCDAAHASTDQLEALGNSLDAARRTLTHMLAAAGCRLRHHVTPQGCILVTAPKPHIHMIDMALTALSHGYDLLADRGHHNFANPLQSPPQPSLQTDSVLRRPPRHFLLENRPRSLPRTDIAGDCASAVLDAARGWPPGVEAATWLTAKTGARISEVLGILCAHWAQAGFGDTILTTNKGQGRALVKRLYLDEELYARLVAYVDGPRQALTGLSFDALCSLAREPDHPALHTPLFLNSRAHAIAYSTYNDYYFRPTMRALGRRDTPHWMRHDHAAQTLLFLRSSARSEAEFERLVDTYAALQGWRSGRQMVEYYAASLQEADQRVLLAQLMPALDRQRASWGAQSPDPRVPDVFAAFLQVDRS